MEQFIKRKNPVLALVLSAFVFAGAGQIYNKQYKKGIILIIIFGILLVLILVPIVMSYIDYFNTYSNIESIDISNIDARLINKPNIILVMLNFTAWLFSVIDAYIYAKKYNKMLEKQDAITIKR